VAAIVGSTIAEWDVERRFRVTEVALAIMWVGTGLVDMEDLPFMGDGIRSLI
jgi:hypothetical protein